MVMVGGGGDWRIMIRGEAILEGTTAVHRLGTVLLIMNK
jgi:hypothetical protein